MVKRYDEPLTAAVVLERADALRDLSHNVAYRRMIEQYRRLVMGTLPGDVPANMARGEITEFHSPEVMQVASSVVAERLGYAQYISVVPRAKKGNPSESARDDADFVERWVVLADQTLDEAKRITSSTTRRQCTAGWAAIVMTTDPEKEWPWSWETPDQMTCFPDEQEGGTYTPNEFAQRYKRPIRELVSEYTQRAGPFSSQKLMLRGGSKRFEYVPLGTERAEGDSDSTGMASSSGRGGIKDVEFIRYDDGWYIYHLVKQPGSNKDAEMLWYERNLCGEVSAVIVPGEVNPEGGDGFKMMPRLWGLMTNTLQLNTLVDVMATLGARDRPDTYIEVSPAQLENMRAAGYALPIEGEWAQNGGAPRQIYIDGKPTMWQVAPNPQLETLLALLERRQEYFKAQHSTVMSPEVQAASTAEAAHLNTGAQNRQQYPMLLHFDEAKRMLLRKLIHTIPEIDGLNTNSEDPEAEKAKKAYAGFYDVVAVSDVNRQSNGKVLKGSAYTLDAAKVVDFDKNFVIHVATVQETEEQRAIRIQQAVTEELNGLSTHENSVAATHPDTAAALEDLLEDRVLSKLDLSGDAFVEQLFQLWLATQDLGRLPVGAMPLVGANAPPPTPPGTGGYVPKPPATMVGNGAMPGA